MSYTIYDIAKAADVSIATVSRVFNDSDSVKKSTRDKILKIADEMGYHPHIYAQSLASKKRNRIMMLVPVVSNYYLTEILKGVQDGLSKFNFELNIINIDQQHDPFQQAENILKKRWAEGYLTVSLHFSDAELKKLKKYGSPISLIDDHSEHFDSFSFDNCSGAYLATKHLLSKGYKRIAVLSANEHSIPVVERLNGYKKALNEFDIPFNEEFVVKGDSSAFDGFSEQSGYEAMTKALEMSPLPDACFSISDIKAVGAQKAMRENKITIPLISFDNIPVAEYIGLSTIEQPMYDMGLQATKKLVKRIQKNDQSFTISNEIFEPNLIIRESSNPQISKSFEV